MCGPPKIALIKYYNSITVSIRCSGFIHVSLLFQTVMLLYLILKRHAAVLCPSVMLRHTVVLSNIVVL